MEKSENIRTQILNKAAAIVSGERQENYGTPEDNFNRIADLWSIYLEMPMQLTAADMAAMMVLFKVARLNNGTGTMDTWIDMAGYAACGGEVDHERK